MNFTGRKIETPFGVLGLRVPDVKDVDEVIDEVIANDCYGLGSLKRDGVEIKYALDVGAHIGAFAAFAKLLWPGVSMSCFEPNPQMAEVCKLNAPWANVLAAAVRYDGKNELFVSEHTAGSCMYDPTVNFDDEIPNKYKKIKVPTLPLDPFITSTLDLLKLDCEGSEFDILSNLSRFTIPHIKRIVGEYHHIAGFRFVEQIINLRFPHLKVVCAGNDPTRTIGQFRAA